MSDENDILDARPEDLDGQPEEVVDALPVLADARTVAADSPPSPAMLPAAQAAAVAATSFLAGAATMLLVRRHDARKLARAQPYLPRPPRDVPGVHGSRTYLVNVSLIAR